ncbi:TPA: hypothetical protein WJI05_000235 [Neisseria meningitidis]|uniref:hypothetical protein n=1 Tax=Neisseria meningitidis TaxID=487 RepID=UPI000C32B1E8|nr:hypothetical protein [Neisseria meningitidis]MCV6772864.1 hypothetical protein [Neisseria meningitidis]
MYELSIVDLELVSGAGPIADFTTGEGGAIGGGTGYIAGKAGGGTIGGILGSPFGPGGTIVGVAAGQQYGGKVGFVIGAGAGSAIGGVIGRGIESILDNDRSGNDYGDGTGY